MVKLTQEITIDIPDADLDVLVEMAGYGIAYWADKADSSVSGEYTVWWTDYDVPQQSATVTYETLAKRLYEVQGMGFYVGDYAKSYFAGIVKEGEGDVGYFDSDLADIVVQLAVFNGEVVYS